jgi:hypothetical protein
MRVGPGCHLTYCTNIHPGESWTEIRNNLERYLLRVRDRIAPDIPFGVGLRLSAAAAEALRQPSTLAEFRDFLRDNRLYVFTINGFPYGTFHRARVKEDVYKPDWRDERRLAYTGLLATLLAELMPPEPDVEGSVSTVPGAFKPEIGTEADVERMADLMIRHAAHLVHLERSTGRTVVLALEPEPYCFLETVDEAVAFFEKHLFSKAAAARLSALANLTPTAAEPALRRHLGLCLDLCHAAVEYEDPNEAVRRLEASGIRIAKLQLSAGLRIPHANGSTAHALTPFADDVYLHQVVARDRDGLIRYPDLPEAIRSLDGRDREWRIHFHVPIFREELGEFATTQPFLREVLARHRRAPVSAHLEVETYTWDVLPDAYRGEDIVAAVSREMQWVQQQLRV